MATSQDLLEQAVIGHMVPPGSECSSASRCLLLILLDETSLLALRPPFSSCFWGPCMPPTHRPDSYSLFLLLLCGPACSHTAHSPVLEGTLGEGFMHKTSCGGQRGAQQRSQLPSRLVCSSCNVLGRSPPWHQMSKMSGFL